MSYRPAARTRTAVVASAAVLAVVTAASMAGAHEGVDEPGSIHACVGAGGALRVAGDPGQACRPSERPLHWSVAGGGAGEEELVAFKQQLLATDNVADLVDWSNLQNVPQWIVDGLPAWLQDGTVTFGDIEGGLPDDTVDGGTVADGSLTGADLDDGTVTARQLAGAYGNAMTGEPPVPGAVTSEKILDGTVQREDLGPGAVTPDKLSPITASSSDAMGGSLAGGVLVPTLASTVTASTPSVAMVSGQVQVELSCASCASTVVQYQLERNGAAVSPVYAVELSTTHRWDVVTVSVMDRVPAGTSAYRLRLSSDPAGFTASNPTLDVHLLGAQ